MANFFGNVHGGTLLKYLDEVAYTRASHYAGRCVMTLPADQAIFREPVHVGELVTFLTSVNYTGWTSMEIGVKVIIENIREQSVRRTNSRFFTMVALDNERKPVAVRPLELETAEQKRRSAQTQQRHQLCVEPETCYQVIREDGWRGLPVPGQTRFGPDAVS